MGVPTNADLFFMVHMLGDQMRICPVGVDRLGELILDLLGEVGVRRPCLHDSVHRQDAPLVFPVDRPQSKPL